jgi:hypothetical protein
VLHFATVRRYFYALLHRYLSIVVTAEDSIVEIEPVTRDLISLFCRGRSAARAGLGADGDDLLPLESLKRSPPAFILLGSAVHYERDVQALLDQARHCCAPETRLIVIHYSALWKPCFRLASWLGIRKKHPETNWLANEDIVNLLQLTGFEPVRTSSAVLLPLWIPFVSALVNRFVSPLPGLRALNMANIVVARPVSGTRKEGAPSVSVVVPARNEAGNIESLIERVPRMGPDDELIFVEGHSTDGTWETIRKAAEQHGKSRRILIAQQDGRGKGDAVRKGFSLATREIFMILDADLTVPPEDLPRFYRAITGGVGEFINGSRLVYPMEDRAMRFLNMLGNRFFAYAFSFVLGQRFKDTLCGTKVLSKANYESIQRHRSFFGTFDPFGDFDLIFGAARLGLKIVEVPIRYRERRYGETNISRWTHGALLLRMVLFAARKIKFV